MCVLIAYMVLTLSVVLAEINIVFLHHNLLCICISVFILQIKTTPKYRIRAFARKLLLFNIDNNDFQSN